MSDQIVVTPSEVLGVLKGIRVRQGLTLRQLGQIVYESNVVLCYRENRKRPVTLETVERWARGLGYEAQIVLRKRDDDAARNEP